MAIRLIECYRVLKSTGSLYLHCDPTMSHYLKTTLDCIFGEKNFRNEIVWSYNTRTMPTAWFARKHDIILMYAKHNNPTFCIDEVRIPYRQESLNQYNKVDEHGRRYKPQSGGLRTYLNEKGQPCPDVWEIQVIGSRSKERTGYPTQKPLALLDRIIKASSNKGDLVLDPFCGCATTCVSAENNGRYWIGIDVSAKAYDLVKERLDREVARPHELPEFRQEIHLQARPPQRTDSGAEERETSYVYIISHPMFPGTYKVGVSSNVQARLNSYQTSDPKRSYQLEFSVETPFYYETEAHIHEYFDNEYEWVTADLADIKQEILNYTGA